MMSPGIRTQIRRGLNDHTLSVKNEGRHGLEAQVCCIQMHSKRDSC